MSFKVFFKNRSGHHVMESYRTISGVRSSLKKLCDRRIEAIARDADNRVVGEVTRDRYNGWVWRSE